MKTDNITAAAIIRARQIATNAIKSKFRDDGHKLQDFRISDFASAIVELSKRPDIMERATEDVERWRSNIKKFCTAETTLKSLRFPCAEFKFKKSIDGGEYDHRLCEGEH
jgi:hypothetical protein